jgi:hypothetical protein
MKQQRQKMENLQERLSTLHDNQKKSIDVDIDIQAVACLT